jgi:phosphoglucosamine mutase
VTSINCHADGFFPHDIEPVEANLGELMLAVRESGADLGIAHDGDADRMMAVDDRGRFISGDKLLAILAMASGARDIVTTIDASMSIDEMHLKVRRTRVGDPYVSEELKKGGGFGGEPSGAWVFPQISLCPDGIFASARIADIASRACLSSLVDRIPSYPVIRGNINGIIPSLNPVKEKLAQELAPISIDDVDGLKLVFAGGWLLVRPSGTEPKIRLSAEAKTQAAARRYYEAAARIIKEHL